MLKFTLVVSWIFSDLMAETIWVRFSAGGAAVAEVAALPVVSATCVSVAAAPLVLVVAGLAVAVSVSWCRSCCRGPRPSCPCCPWSSRSPSHALRLLALHRCCPERSCSVAGLVVDSEAFMPDSAPFVPVSAPFMPDGRRYRVALRRPTRRRRGQTKARSAAPRNQPTLRRGRSGTLRIRKAGSGDQGRRRDRNQKAISH